MWLSPTGDSTVDASVVMVYISSQLIMVVRVAESGNGRL
jgi:hypothetical protein